MKLKDIRTAKGFTRQALAEASGVNVRMIQYYEQGYKDINGAAGITLYRIAQALGCRIEDLLEGTCSDTQNTYRNVGNNVDK